MDFSQLLSQISSLEGAQRQDKTRLAEKEVKCATLSEELEEIRKQLHEKMELLRVERENKSQLEVANRNHEKVEKQLKESLKTCKEENSVLSSKLEKEAFEAKAERDKQAHLLEELTGKYRDLFQYFEKAFLVKKLKEAQSKLTQLEMQLVSDETSKAPGEEGDPQIDAMKSANEDLLQRLDEALTENRTLQKNYGVLGEYTNGIEAQLVQLRDSVCPMCAERMDQWPGNERDEDQTMENRDDSPPTAPN